MVAKLIKSFGAEEIKDRKEKSTGIFWYPLNLDSVLIERIINFENLSFQKEWNEVRLKTEIATAKYTKYKIMSSVIVRLYFYQHMQTMVALKTQYKKKMDLYI